MIVVIGLARAAVSPLLREVTAVPAEPLAVLVVRAARDHQPAGDDLGEMVVDTADVDLVTAEDLVRAALALELLDYDKLTGNALLDSRPTDAGLALLSAYDQAGRDGGGSG